ncbi:MAG: DUF4386 domain-containing protein [Candidatus Lokiarchaeota archaeon]
MAGFLFLFIIITNLMASIFGYKTIGDVGSEAQLQKINKDPTKFKVGVMLILIEHFSIISLAIILFIAFGSYNPILGIVWCISRIGEGLIQIYDKKSYWSLLNLATKYSSNNVKEKEEFIDLGRSILKIKASRFLFAQILFSIGTFAYSLLFIIYGVLPPIIGWFGIIASIIYGFGNGLFHLKSNFRILWNIGGLLVLFFELVLGGWLLIFSHM